MKLDESLTSALTRVTPDMATSSTLPAAFYREEEVLTVEQAAVSQRSWLGIGRGDHWAEPGDSRC